MWHSLQVHYSEYSKNQHIVGKLSPFSPGISEFDETCRFGKRRSKDSIAIIFKFRMAKISKLHQVEGQTTE